MNVMTWEWIASYKNKKRCIDDPQLVDFLNGHVRKSQNRYRRLKSFHTGSNRLARIAESCK